MVFIKQRQSTGPIKGLGFLIILILVLPISILNAKEKWALNTSLSYSTGKYIYESGVDNYTLYLGGRYSNDKFSISMTVPFTMQRDNLDTLGTTNTSNSHMDSDHSITAGVSDVYLYSEYNLYRSFFVTGQIKIPTSTGSTLFSSGEFDYGIGLAFRKMYGTYKLFADAGYLVFGDPRQFSYDDPFVYGIGVAKHAKNGESSVSFYYQEYGRIISGLDPPRQFSVAYFRLISKDVGISFYGSKGFGESSPDFAFSIGMDVTI
ncbi:MAG: hypothetical protein D8M58_17425 [Calditrichaeota bacterium]|nr:MAG: hypothetical protein DWQ03_01340 [Calditrichota bacterium]MBL1207188.1 hypothetical protein [Calditrichota bacterium]NOG47021.1 hypothetical protein [Calditrichota bacterium]